MKMISYAQNHEDVLLNRAFHDRAAGFYVDVGACHPVAHSVTKHFYDRGWHGINIEPNPAFHALLCADRPRDINLHLGLSNRDGILPFYEDRTNPGASTFSRAAAEACRRAGDTVIEREVQVTTLARVCEAYVRQPIDFLKVDVERHEAEVLAGGDWQRWRPRVVVVEATEPNSTRRTQHEWEHHLLRAGYRFALFDGLNAFFVRDEDRDLIPLLSVPVNVLDDFVSHDHHRALEVVTAVGQLGPVSLGVARALNRLAVRLPFLVTLVNWVGRVSAGRRYRSAE